MVGVPVGVSVGVAVIVGVAVFVGVQEAARGAVAVKVGVSVGVAVQVAVAVGVQVVGVIPHVPLTFFVNRMSKFPLKTSAQTKLTLFSLALNCGDLEVY